MVENLEVLVFMQHIFLLFFLFSFYAFVNTRRFIVRMRVSTQMILVRTKQKINTYMCLCMHTYAPVILIEIFFKFRRG